MKTAVVALSLLGSVVPGLAVAQSSDLGGTPIMEQAEQLSEAPPSPTVPLDQSMVVADVPEPDPNEIRPDAIADFRQQLAPYGAWVDHPDYGNVWVPSSQYVGTDFVPYSTGGYWAYGSDYVWNSTYPFADIPFHYGRWLWVSGYGWSWIPGSVYRGAWVTWRTDPYGYVGWAPLGPSWFWWGNTARWGYYGYGPSYFYSPYNYCHRSYLFSRDVYRYSVRGPEAARIAARASAPPAPTGRTLASPTVNPASPAVAPMRPQISLASPTPASLGIAAAQVTPPRAVSPGYRVGSPDFAPPGNAPRSPSYTLPGNAPAYTAPGHAPSYTLPGAPSYSPPNNAAPLAPSSPLPPPRYTAPSQVPSYPVPSAPRYTAPSQAPSYSVPRPSYSPPSYSAPRSAPSYSAPRPSYSPPSYSAPRSAPSYSAPRPSFSPPRSAPSGGGGRSFSPPRSRR